MVRTAMAAGLALSLVATLFCIRASAQSPAICTPGAMLSLMPCLGYITGNSSAPSSPCCTQLANVVQTQTQCLCALLNSGVLAMLGIPINPIQTLTLPSACNVQVPPLSQCNGGDPESAMVPSSPSGLSAPSVPNSPAPEMPSTPSVNLRGGAKSTPATGSSSDGQASNKPTNSMVFAVFFIAAAFLSSFAGI